MLNHVISDFEITIGNYIGNSLYNKNKLSLLLNVKKNALFTILKQVNLYLNNIKCNEVSRNY